MGTPDVLEVYIKYASDRAVLSALVQEGLSEAAQGRAGMWAALRKDRDDVVSLVTALGGLYAHGQWVDWSGFFKPLDVRRVSLPTYPFERQRYWLVWRFWDITVLFHLRPSSHRC